MDVVEIDGGTGIVQGKQGLENSPGLKLLDGRNPPQRIPAVAERVQRVLLLRGLLAGVPRDRLPPRDPHVPAALEAVWPLKSGPR